MKGSTIDKFQVIDHLGNGAFGDVFLCYDPFLQKEIAIKVIKVPDPEKFVIAVKEGQTLDTCRHKHIVDVKDVRATLYNGEMVVIIIMEYLSNYHSDPSDVMGYRPHQPLEVIEGNPMDKLSDIYASGITFYRLLNNTNKLPFTFTTKEEWKKAVKKDQYPPRQFLPHIPEKIIKILNKSIHKVKETRFQNCIEFRQALEKLDFSIDWVYIDKDNWTGNSKTDNYTITKYRKRTGWVIDYKKNNIRKSEHCCINLPDDKVESEFFKIINETTLA